MRLMFSSMQNLTINGSSCMCQSLAGELCDLCNPHTPLLKEVLALLPKVSPDQDEFYLQDDLMHMDDDFWALADKALAGEAVLRGQGFPSSLDRVSAAPMASIVPPKPQST